MKYEPTYQEVEVECPKLREISPPWGSSPIKPKPRSTAVGRAEDYSLLYAAEGVVRDKRDDDIIYLRNCLKELRDQVRELKDIIGYKGIIFESCEEMYSEDWRET